MSGIKLPVKGRIICQEVDNCIKKFDENETEAIEKRLEKFKLNNNKRSKKWLLRRLKLFISGAILLFRKLFGEQ
jgi:hypothetical protein